MLSGDFREDLYYRIKVIEITVPTLRERRNEIPTLSDFFLARFARKYNRPLRSLSDELRRLFDQYDWPGNIRELENMIKRMVILQDEHLVIREIERNMLRMVAAPAAVTAPAQFVMAGVGLVRRRPARCLPRRSPDLAEPRVADADEPGAAAEESSGSLAAVAKAAAMKAERAAIEQTLRQVHWNRRKAAQILGVSYKTLLNKIKECGITRA